MDACEADSRPLVTLAMSQANIPPGTTEPPPVSLASDALVAGVGQQLSRFRHAAPLTG